MLGWLRPHESTAENDTLVRCSCGRAMWLKSSPAKVKKHHLGHRMEVLHRGSILEFSKMKLGLLRRRTLGEWFLDVMEEGKAA